MLLYAGTLEARGRLSKVGLDDPQLLSCREALSIMCGVARALLYLHTPTTGKPQTLHRDVKPGNVLLTESIHPLLADTGLAKAAWVRLSGRPTCGCAIQSLLQLCQIIGAQH